MIPMLHECITIFLFIIIIPDTLRAHHVGRFLPDWAQLSPGKNRYDRKVFR